ncbi:hypothetical protein PU560_09830 [Georgenia sp. 10Sc9-8]|uniref:Uncharacterized protein n=1 Tax=Georgenia halotolerans TaxID=3028317 RepID=A0ABT5TXH5_9MICO|nr:hypothetical protein [Georgenia halotolerans]
MSTEKSGMDGSRTQGGYRTEGSPVTGVADEVHGAAEEDSTRDTLSAPSGVQGGEGGGDPAAGAEEDTADPGPKHRSR